VLRVDLLGHGQSGRPNSGGYEIPEQAGHVAAAMDRLGVRAAIVVGHSTGGSVATALAEQRPDLVTALALIDTGPSADAFLSQGRVGELIFAPGIGALLWRLRTDGLIRRALASAFSRPGYVAPQALVDDVRRTSREAFTATSRAVLDYLRGRPVPDRLVDVSKPLLVIFGDRDTRWRPASAADYRAVPDARVELLAGLGHSPMLEDPAQSAALLLAFAAEVGNGS
jgi:pimeloyl-ACP methyl ester carboxylesterase